MRKTTFFCVGALTFMLAGCGETLNELKDAAAGINSAADEAASAISQDTHSVRAMALTYEGQSVTVNDLFKKVLRDVQWHFDEESKTLNVTGTWQPGLFASAGLTTDAYEQLATEGEITVLLVVDETSILKEKLSATVHYGDDLLFEQSGQDLLSELFAQYNKK